MEVILFISVLVILVLILYFSEIDVLRIIRLSRLSKKYRLKYAPHIYVAMSGEMPEKWKTNILDGIIQGKHISIYDEHTTKDSRDMGIDSGDLYEGASGSIRLTHTIVVVDGHKQSRRQGKFSISEIERTLSEAIK